MDKKTVEMQLNLPTQLMDELTAIAKLAGLPVSSVIKLALATEVRRWDKQVHNA